jgi:effector-binding domain-containing protein
MSMHNQVRQETVEPRPTAVVRRLASQDQLSKVIPEGCGEVWTFLRGSTEADTGLNMALYLDGAIHLECGVLVAQPFTDSGSVACSSTPGGRVATATHIGPYHLMGETHQAILDWCVAQGQTLAGPSWEIYGHWEDDPAKLRTDIYYLVVGPA